MKSRTLLIVLAGTLFCAVGAFSQWREPPATGSPQNHLPDRTKLVGQSGMGPLLDAKLVDPQQNARMHKAVVHVETDGVEMTDPAAANHQAQLDQAHLQYRLDAGPVQDTTAKTWTFGHLSSGKHRITVALAGNDNRQLGEAKTLPVKIP
jgi:hypothetical protein